MAAALVPNVACDANFVVAGITALIMAFSCIRYSIRLWRKRYQDSADEDEVRRKHHIANRSLFSVFVTKEDILASYDLGLPEQVVAADEQIVSDAVYSVPGVQLALVPLVELFSRANSTAIALNQAEGWTVVSQRASLAVVWLFALLFQISRNSPLASLRLFTIYSLLFVRGAFELVGSARSRYYGVDPLGQDRSAIAYAILDLAAIGFLLTTIMTLPLRAPLDLVIRLEHGQVEDPRPPSPEDTNTILGEISYSWLSRLMSLAQTRPLESLDVFALALNNRSEVLSRRFKTLVDKTLARRLLRASARDILIDASLKLTAVAAEYCRPFFIQKILEQLVLDASTSTRSAEPEVPSLSPREKAYVYAALAFASMAIKTLAQQRHFHFARRIGMRLRSELTVEVFDKALRRKDLGGSDTDRKGEEGADSPAEEGASVGRVITLVSEDTNRVLRMGCDSHLLYGSPLEIIVGLSLLYKLMGWSAFVGFSVMLLLSPLSYWIGELTVPVAASRLAARDARQSALQELFSSIRTIKLSGWSGAFIERILDKRRLEISWIRKAWVLKLLFIFVWVLISALVSILSFASFVYWQKQTLTVPIAFTALSYFALIQNPLFQIPDFIVKILQLRVSIGRLESFLAEKEIEPHAELEQRKHTTNLAFEHATLTYPGSDGAFKLRDINIKFPAGELTVISGQTGSGKTSLLLALLGNLDLVSGEVHLPVEVSYASQQIWLESMSVQDNILFGHPLDPIRLKETIQACCLERDLELLPDGVLTFCGERGQNLSGGQKARIALARAVYAPTDIVLLDDIFSAVDATTSAHLVRYLLRAPLLAKRTCLLVTHHTDLVLPVASCHVSMHNGGIARQERIERDLVDLPEKTEEAPGVKKDETVLEPTEEAPRPIGQVAHVEGWTSGAVKTGMYTSYLSMSGWLLWILVVVLLFVLPFLEFGERVWIARWGESSGRSTSFYLIGYSILAAVVVIMIILPQAVAVSASVRGSRILFEKLLVRVVHSPLRWIDHIPLGTLSNRFTNDIATVDDALAPDFCSFGHQSTTMLVALFAGGFILPAAIAPTLLFAGLYVYIFRCYLLLNRDANRIASTTASPLFASFAEALRGVTTIRAFGKEQQFRRKLCNIVDETLAFWYLSATLDIWLDIRSQILAALCLVSTAILSIYSESVTPGLAGVAITSSQSVITSLAYLCSAYGRLVLDVNALERVTEYLEVPQEPVGGIVPPAVWPSSNCAGSLIRVENLAMSYGPKLPPVLQHISFEIRAGERIGIVGRTGAGKSTLATSLLRFSEATEGKIFIDQLDISKVSLDVLRQRITYLPQEATLFEGTLRENIDLFSDHSDDDCLAVLRQVHLLSGDGQREELEGNVVIKLTTRVAAGGTNFSAGQRQLIAMARALLQDPRIVIFDESTASLDHDLDTEIQRVVREEFNDAAILTIAHRLQTVRDYDRILVLDGGRIIEFDTPDALLMREDGAFYKMWHESRHGEGKQ
ncbi:uncharacterized protein JCM15063_000395 [Sporobolomyces koalae]|uniref:uncharacterized protein n=1 Tax=Sporobolomyces koalae TaxID=500713 RepID=UPI003175D4CF